MTKKSSSKTERTNLFFYPDGPESPETWDFDFKFQVFPDRHDRKTNSSVRFWKKFFFVNFAFGIYWPLEAEPYDQLQVDEFLEAEPISNWWFLEVDPLEFDGSALVTTLLGQKVCKSVSKILK